jgi:hypothetical protein
MLEHLRGRVTERKLRLFACACVRQQWDALRDVRSRRAVEVAECYADGLADEVQRFDAWDEATSVADLDALARAAALTAEADVEYTQGDRADVDLVRAVMQLTHVTLTAEGGRVEDDTRCALLRCLFGPRPFDSPPRVADSLRIWDHRTVVRLAETIYEEHAFDLLPVLADALEEAGCTDSAILEHLRGPGPHARGCFALESCLLP